MTAATVFQTMNDIHSSHWSSLDVARSGRSLEWRRKRYRKYGWKKTRQQKRVTHMIVHSEQEHAFAKLSTFLEVLRFLWFLLWLGFARHAIIRLLFYRGDVDDDDDAVKISISHRVASPYTLTLFPYISNTVHRRTIITTILHLHSPLFFT